MSHARQPEDTYPFQSLTLSAITTAGDEPQLSTNRILTTASLLVALGWGWVGDTCRAAGAATAATTFRTLIFITTGPLCLVLGSQTTGPVYIRRADIADVWDVGLAGTCAYPGEPASSAGAQGPEDTNLFFCLVGPVLVLSLLVLLVLALALWSFVYDPPNDPVCK